MSVRLSLLLVCLISTVAFSSDGSIRFIYSGLELQLPVNPTVIASPNKANDHFLLIRYGHEVGENNLGIYTDPLLNMEREGCTSVDILNAIFVSNLKSKCPQESIEAFIGSFIEEGDNGIWEGKGHKVFYSITPRRNFLFIVKPDGKVIQFDSNFLDKPALRKVLANYI